MPRPTIPEAPERSQCRGLLCRNEGTKACSRCKTKYCGVECQTRDWKFHKKFCGKKSYTFKFELLGSSNPKITRIVDVPAWYTFQELHFVIQYAFGPWQQCRLHEFSYSTSPPNRSGLVSLAPVQTVLKILAEGEAPDPYAQFFGGRATPHL
ncbi:hypothetical protein MPER_01488 [Moniliophthora perniciosa FA553]|nr:hypothetical protein MPER_01488 [Moniliophthora perniciosa FA553]